MHLPAGYALTEEPGGRRIIRMRGAGLGMVVSGIGLTIVTAVLAAELLWSVGEGDLWAGIFCIAAPVLLAPLAFFYVVNLVKVHQLVLDAGELTHEWRSHIEGKGAAQVVRLGIIHSPETTDGPELYFLAVAYAGTNLMTLPRWSDSQRDLQALGQWSHEQSGVPFQPEPVPHTGLVAG